MLRQKHNKNYYKPYVRFFKDMLILHKSIFADNLLVKAASTYNIPLYVELLFCKPNIYFRFVRYDNGNCAKLNYKISGPSNTSIYQFIKNHPWLKNYNRRKFDVTYDINLDLWKVIL
jgi:hypothetical protein